MEAIKAHIMDININNFDDELKPEFHGIQNRQGHIFTTVANDETVKWLENNLEKISKYINIPLRILKGDDIPHS